MKKLEILKPKKNNKYTKRQPLFVHWANSAKHVSTQKRILCGLKCKLFHQDQHVDKPIITCTKCWQNGHNGFNGENEPCCAVCKKSGHKTACDKCEFYIPEKPKNQKTFQGEKDVFSIFYRCELNIFGETFESAEQSFQTTRPLRSGDVVAAERIRNSKTALEAKGIDNQVQKSSQWKDTERDVMEQIISAKINQCEEKRDTLSSYKPSCSLVTQCMTCTGALLCHTRKPSKLHRGPGQERSSWGTSLPMHRKIYEIALKRKSRQKNGNFFKYMFVKWTHRPFLNVNFKVIVA